MNILNVNNRPTAKTWNGLVNELFNDFEKSLSPSLQTREGITKPAVNIMESTDGYHVELLGPGRNKENFTINIEKNELIISYNAEKAALPEGVTPLRNEFTIGNFSRNFLLNETIDSESIQAKYEEGILKVFLPKKPETKKSARTINIQ
jgi:HSP20 family protein